ncbi:hypothetical protein B0T19DRAFT_474226 [Cercophora scortea]|uniref:Uncharacterized protein n=1 Tax=Cercophora scortea TaxID=314031 RepID=A0AAE0MIB9_9PEZI|nr:hypothetical protein B0T19DRAFT_474226 [Cercophora scortea]
MPTSTLSTNATYRYTAAEMESDSEKDEHRFPGALNSEPRRCRGWLRFRRVSTPQQQKSCPSWWTIAPWVLSALFASVSLVLFVLLSSDASGRRYGSYEAGFGTDIVTPSHIPLEHIRFKGSPLFSLSSNGTELGYLPPVDASARWPENMDLFGPPSEEVDANWERLIGRRYFSVSEEEAVRAWGEERYRFVDRVEGGYTAGLDMFHTLHCLNGIRMALHPEYYHDKHVHRPFHILGGEGAVVENAGVEDADSDAVNSGGGKDHGGVGHGL